jgi:hypothetical protein
MVVFSMTIELICKVHWLWTISTAMVIGLLREGL